MIRKREAGKHRSVLNDPKLKPAVERVLEAGARRVISGLVKRARHRFEPGTIRVRQIEPGKLLANGYIDGAVVQLVILTDNPDELAAVIDEEWPGATPVRRCPVCGGDLGSDGSCSDHDRGSKWTTR